MKRTVKIPSRLRDMKQECALSYCANLTSAIWTGSGLDDDSIVELWRVFRSYILNDYQDSGIVVPAYIADVWDKCKKLIDREAEK